MTFVIPSDANQCVKLIQKSVDHPGPHVYPDCPAAEPLVYTEDYEYEIGRAIVAHEGNDVTVVAAGCTVAFAVSAANALEKEGIGVRVLDMHTIVRWIRRQSARPFGRPAVLSPQRITLWSMVWAVRWPT